jgi:hypothetical protein
MAKRVEFVKASDVVIRNQQFIWRDRIPKDCLTLLVGDGGVGKGLVMSYLTACLTAGRPLPADHQEPNPTNVLWVGVEDAIDTAIVPRLRVAEADLERVGFLQVKDGLLSLPSDVRLLERMVRLGRSAWWSSTRPAATWIGA